MNSCQKLQTWVFFLSALAFFFSFLVGFLREVNSFSAASASLAASSILFLLTTAILRFKTWWDWKWEIKHFENQWCKVQWGFLKWRHLQKQTLILSSLKFWALFCLMPYTFTNQKEIPHSPIADKIHENIYEFSLSNPKHADSHKKPSSQVQQFQSTFDSWLIFFSITWVISEIQMLHDYIKFTWLYH